MEKDVAINILKDIQTQLNKEDWKTETFRTIRQYEKGLKISTNKKIKKLVKKQKDYMNKYGENRQEDSKT